MFQVECVAVSDISQCVQQIPIFIIEKSCDMMFILIQDFCVDAAFFGNILIACMIGIIQQLVTVCVGDGASLYINRIGSIISTVHSAGNIFDFFCVIAYAVRASAA